MTLDEFRAVIRDVGGFIAYACNDDEFFDDEDIDDDDQDITCRAWTPRGLVEWCDGDARVWIRGEVRRWVRSPRRLVAIVNGEET